MKQVRLPGSFHLAGEKRAVTGLQLRKTRGSILQLDLHDGQDRGLCAEFSHCNLPKFATVEELRQRAAAASL